MNGRPRKLDNVTEGLLKTRVFIARTTNLFSRNDIAEGFGIAVSTVHRYNSEPYRQYSRNVAFEQYRKLKLLDTSTCTFCTQKISEHARCADCGILLHEVDTDRNGGTFDMERCISCYNWDQRRRET